MPWQRKHERTSPHNIVICLQFSVSSGITNPSTFRRNGGHASTEKRVKPMLYAPSNRTGFCSLIRSVSIAVAQPVGASSLHSGSRSGSNDDVCADVMQLYSTNDPRRSVIKINCTLGSALDHSVSLLRLRETRLLNIVASHVLRTNLCTKTNFVIRTLSQQDSKTVADRLIDCRQLALFVFGPTDDNVNS